MVCWAMAWPLHNMATKSFDKFDYQVRDKIIKLALVKPPKGSDPKQVKKFIRSILVEYGIL